MERAATLDDAPRTFILMSRILIGMMMLLLVVLPWSECYSALDSFPRSHDTELSFLTLFAIFGLILLLVRAAKRQLRNLLAAGYWLLSIISLVLSLMPRCHRGSAFADLHGPPLPASSLEMHSLPLQI